jgi:hypothetical protein
MNAFIGCKIQDAFNQKKFRIPLAAVYYRKSTITPGAKKNSLPAKG